MSILDVVLFYSKFSLECKDCVNFVTNAKLPVILIALDTKESRDYASNGTLIQIKKVPSMIVSYSDGNIQLYVGKQKITGWLLAITQRSTQTQPPPEPTTSVKPKEKKENRKKQKKTKKSKHVKFDDDEGGVELIFEEPSEKSHKTMPNGMTSKLSTKPANVSPNASIMSLANQMMAERNLQLGVKDGDG